MQNHFSGYGLPKNIMSDGGGNSMLDKFKRFCKNLNIEHTEFIMPSPEQWTGASVHHIYKWNNENTLILNLTHI